MIVELVGIGILGLVASAAVMYFWPRIVAFFSEKILPWLRKHVPGAAAYIDDLFVWLDGKITLARTAARKLVQKFLTTITSQKTTYTQVSAQEWRMKTETCYRGQSKPVVSTTTLSSDELPQAVRKEIIRHNAKTVVLDQRGTVIEKIKEHSREEFGDEGLLLEAKS